MTGKDAVSLVSRYAPCPHDNADTELGNGKIWAKCYDCGETFQQDNWQKARDASEAFTNAISLLSKYVE